MVLNTCKRCCSVCYFNMFMFLFIFFFFQADDGIRYWSVTGVQTCALPICAPPITIVVAGALSAAVVFAFGWVMPARTAAGTQALEGVLGFEEFLARVESDRIARVEKTPEMFEKFLPFAMALGVEQKWARAFEGICQKPPDWYRGSSLSDFRPRLF